MYFSSDNLSSDQIKLCAVTDTILKKRIKYKTVELIVEKGIWNSESRTEKQKRKVGIRVKYSEIDIRRRIKAAGGTWNVE